MVWKIANGMTNWPLWIPATLQGEAIHLGYNQYLFQVWPISQDLRHHYHSKAYSVIHWNGIFTTLRLTNRPLDNKGDRAMNIGPGDPLLHPDHILHHSEAASGRKSNRGAFCSFDWGTSLDLRLYKREAYALVSSYTLNQGLLYDANVPNR